MPFENLKILELIFSTRWSSIEKRACMQAVQFMKLGHHVHVFAVPDSQTGKFCRENKISHTLLKRYKHFCDCPALIKSIIAGRKHKFDIIHVHHDRDITAGIYIKRYARRGSIVYSLYSEAYRAKKSLVQSKILKKIDIVVTDSSITRKKILEGGAVKAGKVHTIYCGIDLDNITLIQRDIFLKKYEIPDDSRLVLVTDENIDKDGWRLLSQAVRLTSELVENVYFVVADASAGKQAGVSGIKNTVTLDKSSLGDGNTIVAENELPYCDAAVALASPAALDTNALRVMAAGMPVIVPLEENTAELVTDGVNGLVYEHGNSSELSKCIAGLLKDAGLRSKLGKKAVRTARENCELNKKIVEYERLFYNLATTILT